MSGLLFTAHASHALLELLCSQTCRLMTSKAREVVQASIGLLKVLIGSFKDVELARYLGDIVSADASIFSNMYRKIKSMFITDNSVEVMGNCIVRTFSKIFRLFANFIRSSSPGVQSCLHEGR